MPKINGRELIKRIRATNRDVKVIAVTAASVGDETAMLLAEGADDVIIKPLTQDRLDDTLRGLIQHV